MYKPKANLSFTLKTPAIKIPTESYPIYLLITVNRKIARISTGEKIVFKDWDSENGRSLNDHNLNNKLNAIISNARYKEMSFNDEGKDFTAFDLAELIKGKKTAATYLIPYFDDYIQNIKARNELNPKSISRYEFTLKRFKAFLELKYKLKDIKIKDVTIRVIDDFDTYLISVPGENNKVISRNTANGYLKKLKTILLKAHAEGEISINPFYTKKLKSTETTTVYLTKEEINLIKSYDFKNNQLLDKTRDIFLFCCLTGMRINSVMKLTMNNISTENKKYYLNFTQDKIKVRNKIPIETDTLNIIEKYSNLPERKIHQKLLPHLAEAQLNRLIKEIASITGIQKHLHMHVGRHTFAVRYLEEGGSIEALSNLLGHKSLRTTAIYGKITEIKLNKESHILTKIL